MNYQKKTLHIVCTPMPSASSTPWMDDCRKLSLLDFIVRRYTPTTMTYADSEALERDYGFTPKIGIREGLRKFCEWYAEYYQ